MTTLHDKVAIVTGAGRGIGQGIALALANAGVKTVVASRSQSSVQATVEKIKVEGGEALGILVDIGDRAGVFAMVDRTVEAFGRLDFVFNNAQGFGPASKPTAAPVIQALESYDEDEWEHTLRTGLTATFWSMKASFPHLKVHGGRIINFASAFGMRGHEGAAAYNSSKEGIRGLSRTAAREWGKYGITVNVITPMIRTSAMEALEQADPEAMEMVRQETPLRRFGDPLRDAGGLAVFLASEASGYLTGMNFMLDGGHYMAP